MNGAAMGHLLLHDKRRGLRSQQPRRSFLCPCMGLAVVLLNLCCGLLFFYGSSPLLTAQNNEGSLVDGTTPPLTSNLKTPGADSATTKRTLVHDEDTDSLIRELYDVVTPQNLKALAKKYKKQYKDAQPFPHIAIDDIFPKRFLEAVEREIPETKVGADGCYEKSDACFKRTQRELYKSGIFFEQKMGYYTRFLFNFLKSSPYIAFLEELTGIKSLIPDPHYHGSGIHVTNTGGRLGIHADFNKYMALDRRVNAFLYLNPEWPDSYGGHLELWSPDMTKCYQKIAPTMGRFVVFSSTDFSYHGHPEPITAPPGRARRSISAYYYTNGRPTTECLDGDCSGKGHSTMFKVPVGCQSCDDATCKIYEDSSIPHWIVAADFHK